MFIGDVYKRQTLGMAPPYNAMDSTICMGASLSIGHGAQRVFDMTDRGTRVVSVLGAVSYTHLSVPRCAIAEPWISLRCGKMPV